MWSLEPHSKKTELKTYLLIKKPKILINISTPIVINNKKYIIKNYSTLFNPTITHLCFVDYKWLIRKVQKKKKLVSRFIETIIRFIQTVIEQDELP